MISPGIHRNSGPNHVRTILRSGDSPASLGATELGRLIANTLGPDMRQRPPAAVRARLTRPT